MNSIVGFASRTVGHSSSVGGGARGGGGVTTNNGIFDRHRLMSSSSTSLLIDTPSYADGDYCLARRMCSSPVMIGGVGGRDGGAGRNGGVEGVRPSSVETDESIVSRSPDADHDPIDDDEDLSDRVLDQILREHGGGTISFGNAVQPSFESSFFHQTPSSSFPSKANKSRRSEAGSLCRVCGDEATGMYFGALVCVPCKTFYLRYAGSNQGFICKERRCCAITVASRTNCKFCRYQKCIRVGMHRKERPCQVHVMDGQQICSVCHDVANGVHFGVITCEGCKKFFRRGLVENQSYVCKNNRNCEVNPRTRNACRFCRYQKCLQVGMSREAIQMGRPSKPRFEKDASSQEDSFPLGHFHPSVSRPNGERTDPRGNLSPIHSSSINSSVPFSSHPPLSHLIGIQRSSSLSTNSPSIHSSGSRFPANVLQKMAETEIRWDEPTYHQTHRLPPLSVNGSTCAATAHWASTDTLSGGEMVQTMTGEGQDGRVFPKQELDLLDDFTDVDNRCFALSVTGQPINTNDYFLDERRDATNEKEGLWWKRDTQTPASSDPSPSTGPTLVSSSSCPTNPSSNTTVCGRIDAMLSRGKTIQQTTPSSLPNDASLETTNADDARHNGTDALTVNLAQMSARKTMDLQFPLKSVIRIIHSSVANELPETLNSHMPMDIEELMTRYKNYWLYDETGEDPFIVHYSNIYKEVIAAYKTFVVHSQYVNFLLRTELEKCQNASNYNVVDVQWIQDNVVPFYVELSIRYCRMLPGFSSFDLSDQQMLIRLGQSPSRILAAAVHWYRPKEKDFGDFLSWRRNDQFKRLMAEHAAKIHDLDLDLVEASLLNAALIIATDYPTLVNPEPIERQHQDLLAAYKTYTTGKLGTPNDRFQTVIGHMREVRHLGFLHYEMTKTKNMMAEDVTQPPR